MRRHHPPRPRARFAPRLEALEDRSVPAIVAVLNPLGNGQMEVLIQVLGKQSHTVQITDDPANHKVTVTSAELPGVTQTFQSPNIVGVTYNGSVGPNFSANLGPNLVTYVMQSAPGAAAYTVTLNGGPKNDVFIGQVAPGALPGSNVTVAANGYAGNDTLILLEQASVVAGTQLTLVADGGTGHNTETIGCSGFIGMGTTGVTAIINGTQGTGDTESVTYQGRVNSPGTLNIFLLGGAGKDTISADVRLSHDAPGALGASNGTVTVNESGDAGNDLMRLDIHQADPTDKPLVMAFMDGGPGKNTARSNLFAPFAPAGYTVTDVNFQAKALDP